MTDMYGVLKRPILSVPHDLKEVMSEQGNVDALAQYISEQKWRVVDDQGRPLNEEQLRSALEYLLSAAGLAELEKNRKSFDVLVPGGLSTNPVEAIKQLLDARACWLPGAPVQLQRLMTRITASDKDIQALEDYIDTHQLKMVDSRQKPLNKEDRRQVLAFLLNDVGLSALAQARKDFDGVLPERLSDNPVKAYQQMLDAWREILPGMPILLEQLAAELRTDSMVFKALKARLDTQNQDRGKMRDALLGHTGEMNIYSVIQARINLLMGLKDEKQRKINIEDSGLNLFDAATYGFTEDKWLKSGERRLLMGLNTYEKDKPMTIRKFLEGYTADKTGKEVVTKISGPMKSGDLQNEYAWAKDNNPLANFSQSLTDRSKIVSDKVNELTTILNDKSNQYNATIEIMMKFIDKWFSTLSKILS